VTALLVVLGAAVGAPARYAADLMVRRWHGTAFPWGTFVVNVAGCAVLGFLVALPGRIAGPGLLALAGTGFCGALTTYSTFGYETVRLAQSRLRGLAVLNVAGSIAAGLAAAYAGLAVAHGLFG
jgi:fluoride exporter